MENDSGGHQMENNSGLERTTVVNFSWNQKGWA